MPHAISADKNALIKLCKEAGCRVEITNGNHLRIVVPGGGIVHASSTGGDWRHTRMILRDLRHAGLDLEEFASRRVQRRQDRMQTAVQPEPKQIALKGEPPPAEPVKLVPVQPIKLVPVQPIKQEETKPMPPNQRELPYEQPRGHHKRERDYEHERSLPFYTTDRQFSALANERGFSKAEFFVLCCELIDTLDEFMGRRGDNKMAMGKRAAAQRREQPAEREPHYEPHRHEPEQVAQPLNKYAQERRIKTPHKAHPRTNKCQWCGKMFPRAGFGLHEMWCKKKLEDKTKPGSGA